MSLDTPPDSPQWWTLTPDLTAEELRRVYRDPKGSVARYLLAVEAGLEPRLSEEQLAQVAWYDHPGMTPELVPMWLAFDTFATAYLAHEGKETMGSQLAASAVSEAGRGTILEAAARLAEEQAAMVAEVGPRQVELAYDANPPAETSGRALVWLRERLTDTDWNRLRRYLLWRIVPGMGPAIDHR